MRGIMRATFLSLLFFCGAATAWMYSRLQYRMADADTSFAVFDFATADTMYRAIERRVPSWVWLHKEAALRRREVQYWHGAYGSLVSDSVFFKEDTRDSRRHILYADAIYRSAADESSRKAVADAYDRAIARYKMSFHGGFYSDAAYNIEYLMRLKQQLQSRRQESRQQSSSRGQQQGDNRSQRSQYGRQGTAAPGSQMPRVRVFVPQPPEGSRDKRNGQDAGKGTFKKKKG